MIAFPVQCQSCKHFRADIDTANVCAAFPEGRIPIEIIAGRHDHKKPWPGDHGIRYEPMTPEQAQLRAAR